MRHWSIFELRVTTPRLTLRLPTYDDLDELADRALEGVHDPGVMPFAVPWTLAPASELPGNVIRYHLGVLSRWQPDRWNCGFVVVCDGRVVGVQEMHSTDFAVTRQVGTASWLGRAFQGKGIGTEMRTAVLQLAFAGLGAETAVSGAWTTNDASLAVSRKLGYQPNGTKIEQVGGKRVVEQRFRLYRADFKPQVPVEIHGLDACLPSFGLAPSS